MVAIVDYGVGNLKAIQNIIKKIGGDSVITSDPIAIRDAKSLVLPGVGSFEYCMNQLRQRDLIPVLEEEVLERKKNILGLCVGAQMMTEGSEEGGLAGLNWVDAKTKKFEEPKVKLIPHMGWADVSFNHFSSISKGFEEGARFYFVHSYHFEFFRPNQILGTAHYGYDFTCAFQRDNIFGVQFHPEKSHRFGMRLFENFLSL
jgi:imidazole glycerol-phosphate synthase subunit HisH